MTKRSLLLDKLETELLQLDLWVLLLMEHSASVTHCWGSLVGGEVKWPFLSASLLEAFTNTDS